MKAREILASALQRQAAVSIGASTLRAIAVTVTVASLALGTAQCQGSRTTEFAVSDHGVV